VYVCMYVCMYVYIYIYVYICVFLTACYIGVSKLKKFLILLGDSQRPKHARVFQC